MTGRDREPGDRESGEGASRGGAAGPARHVFIVAFGRSGSTLTQKLLNALPGYCIRGENANVLMHLCRAALALADEPMYRQLRALRDAPDGIALWEGGEIARTGWFATMGTPDHPWYGVEDVDAEGLARALFEVFTRTVLRPPPGTRVAGCKEIRWHEAPAIALPALRLIRRHFPGTRFVFQNRAFEELRGSSFWGGASAEAVRARWLDHERLATAWMQSEPGGFRLDHACFAQGPEALRPLFDFLGEPFDRALVEETLRVRLTH